MTCRAARRGQTLFSAGLPLFHAEHARRPGEELTTLLTILLCRRRPLPVLPASATALRPGPLTGPLRRLQRPPRHPCLVRGTVSARQMEAPALHRRYHRRSVVPAEAVPSHRRRRQLTARAAGSRTMETGGTGLRLGTSEEVGSAAKAWAAAWRVVAVAWAAAVV